MTDSANPTSFNLDAGNPALDLVNTLYDRFDQPPTDHLDNYAALVDFTHACGLLDVDVRDLLLEAAGQRPHEAAAAHAATIALRESIYAVAVAVVDGDQPATADLDCLSQFAAEARAAGAYRFEDDGFRWSWQPVATRLERPLWQFAETAVEFLAHGDLSRLRVCAADDCGWLFLDETRNRSRKWCDMATCGNRAKVARYRRREEGLEVRD